MPEEGDRKLFKPGSCKHDSMQGVGIDGKIPVVRLNAHTTPEEQQVIAKATSVLLRVSTDRKHEDYLRGAFKFKTKPFKIKGRTEWDSSLTKLSDVAQRACDWDVGYRVKDCFPRREVQFYHCPKCDKVDSSHVKGFQRTDLDCKHKCGFCFKASPVKIGNANVGLLGMAVPNTKCIIPLTPMMRSLRVLKVLG